MDDFAMSILYYSSSRQCQGLLQFSAAFSHAAFSEWTRILPRNSYPLEVLSVVQALCKRCRGFEVERAKPMGFQGSWSPPYQGPQGEVGVLRSRGEVLQWSMRIGQIR